jgi:tetratricopeptide (TPR) repeat protein
MGITLSDLNAKYQQAISYFHEAAGIYNAARQPRNVTSTYEEMAKICELNIADKLVDLANKKISLGEKLQAVNYLEMACSYYELAISQIDPNTISSLNLYWSCLHTLNLRWELIPESRKLYNDKIKEFIDLHQLKTKVNTLSEQARYNEELLYAYERLAQSGNNLSVENNSFHHFQHSLQKIEELDHQRKAIQRGIIESALSERDVTPDFLNDFEDTINAFTHEIASYLNIKSIGECVAMMATIYGLNNYEMRWTGGREGLKVIDQAHKKFDEQALLLGFYSQNNLLQVNKRTQTYRVGLFQTSPYQFDLGYQKRVESVRVFQDPSKYFAGMLNEHIKCLYRSIPSKSEKMISILLFQLGNKIANRKIPDFPEKAGLTLIAAAEKHGHIEAAQYLREYNARQGLRI